MIRGRSNRNRVVHRAESIYTHALTELLIVKDTLVDYEQIAKQALEASLAFDAEIDRQLGPEDEATNQYDVDTTDY